MVLFAIFISPHGLLAVFYSYFASRQRPSIQRSELFPDGEIRSEKGYPPDVCGYFSPDCLEDCFGRKRGKKGEGGSACEVPGHEPRRTGLAPWIVMPPRTASAQRPIPAPQRWFSFPKWGERHRPGNVVTWGKNLSPCPPAQNRAILEERAVISGTAAKNGLRERTNFSRARKTRSERERPLAQKYLSNTL